MTRSARGLFRATGKKSKPVAVRSASDLSGTFEKVDFLEREKDDFYPTPAKPIEALLHYEKDHLARFPKIWEPAAGLSRIWQNHEPARAYLMRWKIDFTGQGAPPMLNGWFVWDKQSPRQPCQLLMMDRIDSRQHQLPGITT